MKGLWLQQLNSVPYCVKEKKPCIGWVNIYFKDCLCNSRDELSFALGLISLLFWGVAEIPQIVTNFRTKSSHGISLLFLLTWVAGDAFNLVGCLLEPATLPTQFYTALLYTTTTLLLVLQSLYYDHFCRWWKSRKHDSIQEQDEDVKKPLRPHKHRSSNDTGIPIPNGTSKPSPRRDSRDYYYTSARSLAGSATPPIRSSAWPVRSGPSAIGIPDGCSSDDETFSTAPPTSSSLPKPVPRSVGYGALFTTTMSMPHQSNAMMQGYIGFSGRKLLQEHGAGNTVLGQSLGWMMAAIYMGGRIPQIWLNIKRGSVEGLNPLMFIFAVTANITYVGSILVRDTEWKKVQANLPWLLDAGACVLLDLFVSFH
ncbi:OLC1v1009978C1 [Oldenlandia corymbosa var. corymbosa]|uniref:OLC1v1009978C1 n=1 Tax=Oldenlandia corymbosa var. corymbosa TaxID=529605 RepID=A0AAV1DQE5_OLDCO|nr:OLC1v1009978C1 [Oldenlandia corymbosa var. corymbosa]